MSLPLKVLAITASLGLSTILLGQCIKDSYRLSNPSSEIAYESRIGFDYPADYTLAQEICSRDQFSDVKAYQVGSSLSSIPL